MVTGTLVGGSHLIKMTPEGSELWRAQFGQSLAIGVDPRDGSVWAPELGDNQGNSNQVVKLNANGSVVLRVSGLRTEIIGVDPIDGSVLVGLPNENQIVKVDADGVELLRLSGFDAPYSITVDPRDSNVWIADGAPARRVVKLDGNGHELFRRSTPGFFSNSPQQIAIDPRDGSAWHAGFGDVFKLSAGGAVLEQVGGFDRPVSVAVDPRDGSVWVSDFSVTTSGAVVKLDEEGNELVRIALDSPPRIAFVNPEDGSVWAGIEGALVKLSSTGETLATLSVPGTPNAIIAQTVAVFITQVDIDIKPGSDTNPINLKSRGVIPVAILGTTDFDVTEVDRATLAFGPGGATPAHKALGHVEDVNDDGYDDLISHYRTQETSLSASDTEACVTATLIDGTPIEGCDAVRVRG
jgi:hypothetical protein